MSALKLSRNAAGRLILQDVEGGTPAGVTAVRNFPISAPGEGISLVGEDGRELHWIAHLDTVPQATRTLIEDELARREFMPQISHIRAVSSFATPSRWQVTTDRGETELLLKTEEHIRRLAHATLLITDAYGVSFLIQDAERMDAHSRRLLDRFL